MSYYTGAFTPDDAMTSGVLARRVWGWVIDVCLIAVLVGVLYVVLLMFGLFTLGLGLPLLGVLPLVPVLYHFLFLAGHGSATPGQQLFGLVVRRNDDLGRPTPLQALLSTVGFYVTLACGVIWLGVALFTIRKRTLHDMLAGTVVVRARALTPPAGSWNMPGGPPYA